MKDNTQPLVIRSLWTQPSSVSGFTLLEMVVLLTITGILFAIAAPSWDALMNRIRLSTAQDAVFQAMRTAQSKAKISRITWQVSFREDNEIVQWTVHPSGITPDDSLWESLDKNIRLEKLETVSQDKNGVYKFQFNYLGRTHGRTGQLTLKSKTGGQTSRCVYVSTLLGALRKGENHAKKNADGKTCY